MRPRPTRAQARPAPSPTASPTASAPASSSPTASSPSPSPTAQQAKCAAASAISAPHGVQARTFHAAALRQLQFFWPKAVGGELPRIVDRKIQLVADAAAACRIRLERGELRDVTAEIEWSKVTQTVPADYAAAAAKTGRLTPRNNAETAQIYAAYETLKRDRTLIDFEDVLLLTVGILQDRHDIADQVRSQYQHFVVDEYQDVSPLQQRLLELWLGDRDNLCVVGDASQTIYSFTGATPDHLLNFRTRHPNATVVKLVRDYRSTPR